MERNFGGIESIYVFSNADLQSAITETHALIGKSTGEVRQWFEAHLKELLNIQILRVGLVKYSPHRCDGEEKVMP